MNEDFIWSETIAFHVTNVIYLAAGSVAYYIWTKKRSQSCLPKNRWRMRLTFFAFVASMASLHALSIVSTCLALGHHNIFSDSILEVLPTLASLASYVAILSVVLGVLIAGRQSGGT